MRNKYNVCHKSMVVARSVYKRIMYLKIKEKKSINNPHYIPKKKKILTLTKMSYANSPSKNMTTLIIPKLLPLFVTNYKG